MTTKNEVFDRYLDEYLKASKERKGKILDAVCDITDLHRKAAVRKFHTLQMKDRSQPSRCGRPITYTQDSVEALRTIWRAASNLCGELLYGVVHEYVEILKRDGQWVHTEAATQKLLVMSETTMKRRIGAFHSDKIPRKGIGSTDPSKLKALIPIFRGPWDDKPAGYGQIDTVVHCGTSLVGSLVFTVNYTDVATLWIALHAQWNKGQHATQESLLQMTIDTPFPIKGMHPDSGSEFINWHMKDWCDAQGIEYTRSRANRSNDNAYVEQKNGHVVRRFLGYGRFDEKELVDDVNEIYAALSVYVNHFLPSRKCLEKVREGAKYKKTYDKAQTPYVRVLASKAVTEEVKDGLRREHEKLNPLILKEKVDTLISTFNRKVNRLREHRK